MMPRPPIGKKTCLPACLAVCLAACFTISACKAGEVRTPLKTLGYMAWWMPDSWRGTPLAEFDRILFFELKIDANGALAERNGWPERWLDLKTATTQQNTALDLVVTLFDPASFNGLFTSVVASQRMLEELTALVNHDGVAGLHLDIEIYSQSQPAAVKGMREVLAQLSSRMHQMTPSRTLSVFFPVGADTPLYDAATVAQLDYLVLQGYDSHWLESKNAGPLAPVTGKDPVTWEGAVAQGLLLGAPREKLVLSFPLYGYEWPVKDGKPHSATLAKGATTTFADLPVEVMPDVRISVRNRVSQYGGTYEAASGSSYYQYKTADGKFFEGWFEDWWTLGRKTDYLIAEKLGGIAFFPLGYDNGQLVNNFLQRRGMRGRQAGSASALVGDKPVAGAR